jgi:RNA polymerase sigma-70 factor (ECF subfamily)
MRAPSPANLLAREMAAGNPQAYAALYDRLARSLWRVAMSMLRDHQAAEDAVQETFVNLVKSREALARVQDLDAYVFACLRSAVLRRIKKNKTERRHLQWAALMPGSSPDVSFESDDRIGNLLARLPAEQREVVALKIDGDLTFAQIAQVLNVSPNTAASRYRYAIDKLRRAMEESNER